MTNATKTPRIRHIAVQDLMARVREREALRDAETDAPIEEFLAYFLNGTQIGESRDLHNHREFTLGHFLRTPTPEDVWGLTTKYFEEKGYSLRLLDGKLAPWDKGYFERFQSRVRRLITPIYTLTPSGDRLISTIVKH